MNNSNRTVILLNPGCIKSVSEFSMPMGLILTAINVYEKFRVVIIDQMVDHNWKSKLSQLLEERPVCIGITSMTGKQIQEGLRASKIAHDKSCPVVWGGLHPTLLPSQTVSHPLVDYVIEGEGEESFAELVEALASGASCEGIPGVWCEVNGTPISGGSREFVKLDDLPVIPYQLVDLSKYIRPGPFGKSLILYSSRGCPQRCSFCFNHRVNHCHWRAFSSERVLGDIRRIRRKHPEIQHVQFWDDSFFVDLKRAREIAEGIREIIPAMDWSNLGTHIRDVVHMDDEYLACLRDSGLKEVLIGVESGSQRIIDMVHKNFVAEELFETNRRLGRFGIRPTYTFISGIPEGDDDEDIRKTTEAMFKVKKENSHAVLGNIKPFVCYPGTELYEKALNLGFKPPERLEEWSKVVWTNYMDLDISWVSPKRQRQLSYLYYYTVLMNPEYTFINSKIFTLAATILRPIAEWRVRRLCFRFPVVAWSMQMFQRYCM